MDSLTVTLPSKAAWNGGLDIASQLTAGVALLLATAVGLGTLYTDAYLLVHGVSLGEVHIDAVAMAIQSLAGALPIYAALSIAALAGSETPLDRLFRTRRSRALAEGGAYFLGTLWSYPILAQQNAVMWLADLVVFGVSGLFLYFGFLSLNVRDSAKRNLLQAAEFAAAGLLVLYVGAGLLHAVADTQFPNSTSETTIQTTSPLPGLAPSLVGATYEYGDLYVVYRDPDTWFVATRTSGAQTVFAIAADNVRSVTLALPGAAPHPSATPTPASSGRP